MLVLTVYHMLSRLIIQSSSATATVRAPATPPVRRIDVGDADEHECANKSLTRANHLQTSPPTRATSPASAARVPSSSTATRALALLLLRGRTTQEKSSSWKCIKKLHRAQKRRIFFAFGRREVWVVRAHFLRHHCNTIIRSSNMADGETPSK